MIVCGSHGRLDLFLQTVLVLIAIVDADGVAVVGVVIGLRRSGVGVTDLWSQDKFVKGVDLVLHFQSHLCIPRLAEFVGGVFVNIGGFFAVTTTL